MMEYLFLLKSMLDTLSVSKTSLLFTKSNTKIVFLVIMHFYNLEKERTIIGVGKLLVQKTNTVDHVHFASSPLLIH